MHETLVRRLRRNRHERRPAVTRGQLVQQIGPGAKTLPDAVGRQAQEIADRFDPEGEQALAHIRIEIDARERHALHRTMLFGGVLAHRGALMMPGKRIRAEAGEPDGDGGPHAGALQFEADGLRPHVQRGIQAIEALRIQPEHTRHVRRGLDVRRVSAQAIGQRPDLLIDPGAGDRARLQVTGDRQRRGVSLAGTDAQLTGARVRVEHERLRLVLGNHRGRQPGPRGLGLEQEL